MGFFSFITSDTFESIPNVHSGKPLIPVTMKDHLGNEWHEASYEGYGDFGGKDFFELVDEMNGGTGDRDRGIKIFYPISLIDPKQYKGQTFNVIKDGDYVEVTPQEYLERQKKHADSIPKDIKLPILVVDKSIEWNNDLTTESCPHQGYFYDY